MLIAAKFWTKTQKMWTFWHVVNEMITVWRSHGLPASSAFSTVDDPEKKFKTLSSRETAGLKCDPTDDVFIINSSCWKTCDGRSCKDCLKNKLRVWVLSSSVSFDYLTNLPAMGFKRGNETTSPASYCLIITTETCWPQSWTWFNVT